MLKTSLFLLLVVLTASPAFGAMYRYVDRNGVVCYTDSPLVKHSQMISRDTDDLQSSNVRSDSSGMASDYSYYVYKAAAKYDIEPKLIKAVIKTESNGDRTAVSRKGAKGLMQLMPSTAEDMNVAHPFNAKENIEGGTKYLKYLLERFNGDLTLALAAYNAGPRVVEKYGSVPPIRETRNYVKKVLSLYRGRRITRSHFRRNKRSRPMRIYKVVQSDGTTLFTNSSLASVDRTRF